MRINGAMLGSGGAFIVQAEGGAYRLQQGAIATIINQREALDLMSFLLADAYGLGRIYRIVDALGQDASLQLAEVIRDAGGLATKVSDAYHGKRNLIADGQGEEAA